MSAENHLTVRDYFDRVLGGRPRNKKGISSGRTRSSGTREFHQILTSRRMQRSTKPQVKSGGLKITDYLARPVRAKSKFKLRPAAPPAKKNTANIDTFPQQTTLSNTGETAKNTATQPPARIKDISKSGPFTSRLTEKQTVLGERQKIKNSILKAAQKYELPVNLIKGVIRAESNFQVKAVSHAGAQGLMQLMPDTARDLGVKNPFNIEENIDGGSRYLRKMLDSFGGDLKLALAAYNAGPEAVIKYGGKIPPFRETQQYVRRVLRYTRQMA